jgi:hypothetical protein
MMLEDFTNYYSNPEPVKEAKLGRPAKVPKRYIPSTKAFEVGFAPDSVEGAIIQFVDEQPATMEELVQFLRANYDEYHAVSICKEKIREMLLTDILDFAEDEVSDDEKEVPELELGPDEYEPDLHDYLEPGAFQDYERSQPGHW